uniref:Uncharacterized protein n=1 Tax=Oryzias latipes TaxID=8090 RepID=H2MYF8_ORYLA
AQLASISRWEESFPGGDGMCEEESRECVCVGGGGLWARPAGESLRDGKNVKPASRHSLQRVSVCLAPCLHVSGLSHIYRTVRPTITFKVSTPA